jgi:hypothetical protein
MPQGLVRTPLARLDAWALPNSGRLQGLSATLLRAWRRHRTDAQPSHTIGRITFLINVGEEELHSDAASPGRPTTYDAPRDSYGVHWCVLVTEGYQGAASPQARP